MPNEVGDTITFEWRVIDTQDPVAVRQSTRWIKWTGIVLGLNPAVVAWHDTCEEREEPVTAWPVAPCIADETFLFEERLATVTRAIPRVRPSLGLKAITPHSHQQGTTTPSAPGPRDAILAATAMEQPNNQVGTHMPRHVFENIAEAIRGDAERVLLVPGLKIPGTIDARFRWCYPHLTRDPDLWESEVIAFQTTKVGGTIDDQTLLLLEQQRRLVRVWLGANTILPPRKEDVYAPINGVATILGAFIGARYGARAKYAFLEEVEDGYHSKNFIDFAMSYKKHSKTQSQGNGQGGGHGGKRPRNKHPFRSNANKQPTQQPNHQSQK
jgi:hypothetical protein